MSNVLIVEDEADIRRLLEIRLTQMGHVVISAGSAAEALEAVSTQGVPDMAVLDIVMHGTTGLELLRELRAQAPSRNLPVILLTARDWAADAVLARELNADLVQKPIEVASLTRAVDRALAQHA